MLTDRSPPVLPTVETTGYVSSESLPTSASPLSPKHFTSAPRSRGSSFSHVAPVSPGSPTSPSGAAIHASSSFRRHHRKRSSTIFVQPRPAPPAVHVEETPLASGLVRGVTTLAGAQLVAKLLAFVLNQLLIRMLGARELGASSQLDLLVGTALALSRDALRLSSQRHAATKLVHKSEYTTDGRAVLGTVVGNSQEIVNLGWIAALVGTVIASLVSVGLYALRMLPTSAIGVAAAAAVTELAAEPCFLLSQLKLNLEQRARAESAANAIRVVVIAFALVVLHISPFLGFAIGHLGYALTLAAAYYMSNARYAREDGFSLLPQRVWTSQRQHEAVFVSYSLWNTSLELEVQQIMKFLLSEGDKLAVGFMTALEEQGEYALAGNYGSLLARLVFLPVEEALRGYFARVFPKQKSAVEEQSAHSSPSPPLGSPNTPFAAAVGGKYAGSSPSVLESSAVPEDKIAPSSPTQFVANDATESVTANTTNAVGGEGRTIPDDKLMILTGVLRSYFYLGMLATGFGPLVAGYVISFVVKSSRFGNAADVLAAYACYIPVLAWNGVLEALVQSVASLHTLRIHGAVLAGIAVLFILLTYLFVSVAKLGAVGIVWAQIITMSVRAAYNLQFAIQYFARGRSWIRDCVPQWWVGIIASVSIGLSHYAIGRVHTFQQFVIVCLMALPVLGSAFISELDTIRCLKSSLRSDQFAHSSHAQLKLKQE